MSKSLERYDGIETLESLQAVRKRPGMYIGSTTSESGENPRALLQIAQEVLSNSTDEALVGFGKQIDLVIYEDNSVSIADQGRGLPMGKNFKDVINSATVMHSSGKFDSKVYRKSGGQNGVGMKATNAVSRWFKIDAVTSVGDAYSITFEQAKVLEKTHHKAEKNTETGTTVTFLPDDRIFDNIEWDRQVLMEKLDNAAYLTPGVTYTLTDRRELDEDGEPFYVSYLHENGLVDLVNYYAGDVDYLHESPIYFEGAYLYDGKKAVGLVPEGKDYDDVNSIDVSVALLYTELDEFKVVSFANGIPTKDGGFHEVGLKNAIHEALSDYARNVKGIKHRFELSDARDGLVVSLSLGIPEHLLQFEGQTKEKLGTSQASTAVKSVVVDRFGKYLYDHPKIADILVSKMEFARKDRLASKEARSLSKKKFKAKSGLADKFEISSKLTTASSKNRDETELFIVEGDSAGGSAKNARNPRTQAILPLRGKPLNVRKASKKSANSNIEITTLNASVGVPPFTSEEDFDYDAVRYGKYIIMPDADVDGNHIAALLLTYFWEYHRPLVTGGYVYLANAPLFKFTKYVKGNPELLFALDQAEFDKARSEGITEENGWEVTRMKGLGEMNYEDLKTTTMDPETRRLSRVSISDEEMFEYYVKMLMSDEMKDGKKDAPAFRREFLIDSGTFELEDGD